MAKSCTVCGSEIRPPDYVVCCDLCHRSYHAESCGDERAYYKGKRQRCDDCKAKTKEVKHAD